jgi:hypothetical protein
MDTRQIEGKQIEAAKADSRNMDELSIKNCVARLNIMTVPQEEKVKNLEVFKNAIAGSKGNSFEYLRRREIAW